MRLLKLALGLAAATLVQIVGTALWPPFAVFVDLPLVVALLNALDGHLFVALVGGLAAGFVTDALTGGPFGLHGVADTILAYATALAARRLVIEGSLAVLSLGLLAAGLQQAIVAALISLLFPNPEMPAALQVTARMVSCGVTILVVHRAGRRLARRRRTRRRRPSPLRIRR